MEISLPLILICFIIIIFSCKKRIENKRELLPSNSTVWFSKYVGKYHGNYFRLKTDSPYGVVKSPSIVDISLNTYMGKEDLCFSDSANGYLYKYKITFFDSFNGKFQEWPRISRIKFINDSILQVELCQTPNNNVFYWWECLKMK